MPTHDIIDNRTERLIDHLNQVLGTSESARFAVGYFFLSGLTSNAKQLLNLIYTLAYRVLDDVQDAEDVKQDVFLIAYKKLPS